MDTTSINYKKPNFFIVGSPKCGTSAISRFLRWHPEVFFSNPKETNYFCPDIRSKRYASEAAMLETCFAGAADYTVVGEGSVMNMYSDVAVPAIQAFNPEAKYIVFLRQPIDLFVSLYHHLFAMGIETARTAPAAWNLQRERAENQTKPEDKLLLYGAECSLGWQLERLMQRVPREQLYIGFYEDFATDPRSEYLRILAFLNLSDDGRTEFPVYNKSRATFTPWLQTAIRRVHRFKRRQLGIKVGIGNTRLVQRFIFGKKRPLANAFRAELDTYFADDITLLETLTNRDLSHWRETAKMQK